MVEIDRDELLAAAKKARDNAVATYSSFKVGAALLKSSGEISPGCNVENASYGLTMCAERVALYASLAHGERDFSAIAIVTQTDEPSSPCGPCRQLLWEFCGEIPVFLGSSTSDRVEETTTAELLPMPFDLERT